MLHPKCYPGQKKVRLNKDKELKTETDYLLSYSTHKNFLKVHKIDTGLDEIYCSLVGLAIALA